MKLDKVPDSGRIIVGNLQQEHFVAGYAKQEGLDYMVSDLAPWGRIVVMDVDAIMEPFRSVSRG